MNPYQSPTGMEDGYNETDVQIAEKNLKFCWCFMAFYCTMICLSVTQIFCWEMFPFDAASLIMVTCICTCIGISGYSVVNIARKIYSIKKYLKSVQ